MENNLSIQTQKTESEELSIIEKVVVQGDLSPLNAQQRVLYYKKICESVGLNPYTKPFDYLMLNGKLILYAKKDCAEQLRKLNGVSITSLEDKLVDDIYIVTAKATTKDGRSDQSKGAVVIGHLKGEQKANAIMKAETKAKRRVTLSISGIGFCDESEVDSIPNAKRVEFDLEAEESKAIEAKPVEIELTESLISPEKTEELTDLLALCSADYQDRFNKWLIERKKINSISCLSESCYRNVKKTLLEKSAEYQMSLQEVANA